MPNLPPLPDSFPALPEYGLNDTPWSPNVLTAVNLLQNAYSRATTVLRQEADSIRLQFHINQLTNNFMPILEAMERQSEQEHLSQEYLQRGSLAIGILVLHLKEAYKTANNVDNSKVQYVEPITVVRTGRKGRPRKVINLDFLQAALSPARNMSLPAIAKLLNISRVTLSYYIKLYGLERRFEDLSDEDLDILVRTFKEHKPESGLRYLLGFLRSHNLRIHKERVRLSLARIDDLGRAIRGRTAIHRRKYTSTRPNYIWHCDGHHKLIKWGIVIHGFIDGYSRTVTGIRASTTNSAETVLSVFMDAIAEYGTPSRVRGDRGGENVEVSVWMILKRGPNRASFMWGSSTHNTRIERLWVEVGRHFCRSWRAFFTRLGTLHRLEKTNPHHLWLLHYLFLSDIQADCKEFQETWNAHPISGPDTKDRSPNMMRFQGQTTEGIYVEDEFEGIHPDVLNQYLGTTHQQVHRQRHQTGAGNPPEEEDSDEDSDDEEDTINLDNLGEHMMADQSGHVRHPPIEVPSDICPFTESGLALFQELIGEITANNIIPVGFGVREEEWIDGEYPSIEVIKTGRRSKEITVMLSDTIWRPRAELWAQGLDAMMQIIYSLQE